MTVTQTTGRVLVPEKLSPDGLALLRKSLEVDEKKGLSPDEIRSIIPGYDALVVRSETKVTEELLKAGTRLKVVARAGVGTDNIDVSAATKLGIIVVNSPSGNIGAAAEHTIALLLCLARNVPDGCASIKAGKWERSRLVGVEVKGKTLGVIGLGKVGLNVSRMAIGLGMRVEAIDPYASPAIAQAANVTMVPNLSDLLGSCDFLTIHTPLIASTKGMISSSELNSMKKGARVMNVARGGMIDETALLTALDSGQIAGAALDVFTSEPPAPECAAAKAISHPKVVATPHLGASTVEAQENVSIDVCEQVLSILAGDLPRSAVNAPLILPEEYRTLAPFVRLVEKIGSLYTQYYSAPQSKGKGGAEQAATTFDLVYEGALADISNTKPLYAALVKGLVAPISDTPDQVNIVNAELVAKTRGVVVNEQKSRAPPEHNFSSLVTLRARPTAPSREASRSRPSAGAPQNLPQQTDGAALAVPAPHLPTEKSISGYVSNAQIYISRLDRYAASFAPEGNLLLVQNYDAPGAIGRVGSLLGKEGVNINFMTVAPLTTLQRGGAAGAGVGPGVGGGAGTSAAEHEAEDKASSEALMILGMDKEASGDIARAMRGEPGILDVCAVAL